VTVAILGATGGIGREIAHEIARGGLPMVLIGRNETELSDLATALITPYRINIDTIVFDANIGVSFAAAVAKSTCKIELIRTLYCPIGNSRSDDNGLLRTDDVKALFDVNFFAVQDCVAEILPHMLSAGHGTIVGFSSVAAVRGRQANAAYAAAKCALESYFESVRHLCSGSAVRILVLRLGYVSTQQTDGKRSLFPAVSPRRAALDIVRYAQHRSGLLVYPAYWRPITAIIKLMPWAVFSRLRF
jgi:decaprenylphospho-beta-D-erythro-pentofuranosid-2-ulose 2-reductase